MKNAIVLLIAALIISGIAAASTVVVYLDETGAPYGYLHPDAYDINSALNALSTPPSPEEAGRVLTSAIPPGTKILDVRIEGDTAIVEFSKEITAGLDEALLGSIVVQVRNTLYQFGIDMSLKLMCDGKLLSDYLPPTPAVQPKEAQPQGRQLMTVGLAGRTITVSPGHGKRWNGSGWNTARPVYCSPLSQEDYHNLDNSQYLETYLLQDSATVKMVRCTDKNYGASPWAGGELWWRMGSCYWLQHIGYPGSVYGPYGTNLGEGGSDDSNEIASRPLSSDYDGSDIYISLHTNGLSGDCTGACPTGTCTYYDAGSEHAAWGAVSQSLANNVNDAIISAIRTKYPDAGWSNRGVFNSNGAYGEIRIPDRAAILMELAFHDSCDYDAVYLRDNFFRSTCMWAVYKGTCDYFGVTPTWDYYSYEIVSHDIPSYMEVGQYYTVHITLRNRGVLWTEAKQFRLGAVDESDPFTSVTRKTITGEVGPNSTYTFTLNLRAPIHQGTYTTDWRMLREGVNWFGPTVSQTIEVGGVGDEEAPTVPTNLVATPISHLRVNLTWTASTDNLEVLGYNIYRDNVNIATSPTNSYSDSTCSPGTTYTYEVSAYDDFENESARSDPAVATTPAGDIVAPSVPTSLVATGINVSQIDLSWTASTDNVAVTGYKIYRDGAYYTSAPGTTYSNTGLSDNDTHTYAVSAYDAADNESAQSTSATATSWAKIYEDGIPDLSNWPADVVYDATTRGGTYDESQNHASYTGAGSIATAVGTAGGNGCLNYRALGGAFTSGRMEAYFYDEGTVDASKQGIWCRVYNGATYTAAMYLGTYAPQNQGRYSAGVSQNAGVTWTWGNAVKDRVVGWRNLRIDVMPSGTNPIKFFVDGTNVWSYSRFTSLDTYGVTRTEIGHDRNVYFQGWFDDLRFSVPSPNAPTIGTPSNVAVSSIRWNFTDSSDSENAFVLHDDSSTEKGTGAKNGTYIDESGLAPNTECVRHVHGKNGTVEGPASAAVTKYTLSAPPSISNVTCDKPTGTWQSEPEFTFTAVGGFGPGTVQYYRCAWDQTPTHTWSGTEPMWSIDTTGRNAISSGSWYFHVRGYNGDDVANGTLDLGPYTYDDSPPTLPTVVDEGAYTPSTTELQASWTASEDFESGVVQCQYAIGTSEGDNDVVDWTPTTETSVTRTGLTLATNQTYYFSVRAQNGAGAWSMASSDGIKPVADSGDIADAKAHADGAPAGVVALNNKMITANFGSYFYIEEYGTFSAIRVEAEGPLAGSTICVAGELSTSDCERRITSATVKDGSGALMPPARFMRNATIGGDLFNVYTPGLPGKKGLHNIGLLIDTCGKIKHLDTGFMYIDDGSNLHDGSGYTGLRVDISGLGSSKLAELSETKFAFLRGIITAEPTLSDAPLLMLRDDSDVISLYDIP